MADFALTERDEAFIKRQVESGQYSDASEVVSAGLRVLADRDDARDQWLRKEIPGRIRDLRGDPSLAIPLDTVFSRLEARHRAALAKNR